MSSFTSELVISPLPDGRKWKLVEAFGYVLGLEIITVPAGFITDFASVPRGLWNLLPPWGRYGKAAVLHDFLYFKGWPKGEADTIFLAAMKVLGVSLWKRWAMYQAVKWFGGAAYRSHRAKAAPATNGHDWA